MPVNQFSAPHLQLPQLVQLCLLSEREGTTTTTFSRLRQVPAFTEIQELMAKGMSLKLMPPKILPDKVAPQAEKIIAIKAEESPFAQPVA